MKWLRSYEVLRAEGRHNRSKTVRLVFPFFAIVALVLGAAVISSGEKSYVRISTTPSFVTAGERFVISVYARAGVPTNAVDIEIEYPDAQIEIKEIDTGESVITIWAQDPYISDGTIYLRGGVFGRGFLGEHLIARFDAEALETGLARIITSESLFLAGDGKGSKVPLEKTGSDRAEVYVSGDGTLSSTITIKIITDLDGDGDVDFSDIRAFMIAWLTRNNIYDFNGDGRMSFSDFSILLADSFFK